LLLIKREQCISTGTVQHGRLCETQLDTEIYDLKRQRGRKEFFNTNYLSTVRYGKCMPSFSLKKLMRFIVAGRIG